MSGWLKASMRPVSVSVANGCLVHDALQLFVGKQKKRKRTTTTEKDAGPALRFFSLYVFVSEMQIYARVKKKILTSFTVKAKNTEKEKANKNENHKIPRRKAAVVHGGKNKIKENTL